MATVYGVNRTLKRAAQINTIEPEVMSGKVRWIYESYEAASLATGSVIELFGQNLPAEARIVDWIIDHDTLSGDYHLEFGTSEDADEFMAKADCSSADKKNFTDDGVAASLGFEIASGDGQTLVITTSGASSASGTIKVAVAFVSKA